MPFDATYVADVAAKATPADWRPRIYMGVFPSRQLVSVAFSQNHKNKLVQVDWGARYIDSQSKTVPF